MQWTISSMETELADCKKKAEDVGSEKNKLDVELKSLTPEYYKLKRKMEDTKKNGGRDIEEN